MDLFDLIGPVMIGPSSSHTAGAARIGLTAYYLQNPIKSATLPAQETYAAPDNAPNTLF